MHTAQVDIWGFELELKSFCGEFEANSHESPEPERSIDHWPFSTITYQPRTQAGQLILVCSLSRLQHAQ